MSAGDRYESAQGRSGSQSYLEDRKPYCSRLEKDDSPDFKKVSDPISLLQKQNFTAAFLKLCESSLTSEMLLKVT